MIRRTLNIDDRTLAVLIWTTAFGTAITTYVLAAAKAPNVETLLAAGATAALAYIGYDMYSHGRERIPTRWQTIVWVSTFLITLFILARALVQHHL